MAKAKDPLVTQAERDTRIALRPQRQALKRARRAGTQDYKTAEQRVQQVTSALLGQLGQIPGAYQGQVAGIMPNLTASIGSLGSMLNSDLGQVPQAEQAAGAANIGAIGAGTLEQLASGQQNMANYIASSKNQGAVQGAVTAQNYAKDYANFMKQNRQQVVDVTSQAHDLILQRLDQLKQEKFDRTMALKQLGMQQSQIDAANRSTDAAIWYYTHQTNNALNNGDQGHGHQGTPPTPTPQSTSFTGMDQHGNVWVDGKKVPSHAAAPHDLPPSMGTDIPQMSKDQLTTYLQQAHAQGASDASLLIVAREWAQDQPGTWGNFGVNVAEFITQLIQTIKAYGGGNG